MSHQIPETTKAQVDQALQYLAAEGGDERTRLDDTMKVIDGLLNLVQQLFTQSCRNAMRNEHSSKPSYNSMDMSQHHESLMQWEKVPGLRTESAIQMSSYQQTTVMMQGQVREKLLDLE